MERKKEKFGEGHDGVISKLQSVIDFSVKKKQRIQKNGNGRGGGGKSEPLSPGN